MHAVQFTPESSRMPQISLLVGGNELLEVSCIVVVPPPQAERTTNDRKVVVNERMSGL
jgi:hypothetical protein